MIHDGLLARAGVAKVYWQEMEEIDEQEFTDLTEAELDMLLASMTTSNCSTAPQTTLA